LLVGIDVAFVAKKLYWFLANIAILVYLHP